ncbi:Hypothetical predicted protein [Xyrichtys novacula]|uniref:Uncharacterized protein n=1 Tax=Xyrichtys novacula TaxID=13765 RepID=A0AAV1F3F0_XYRNO|nr:Hypothetical predicted protein [Xyrichtys novacula]
MGSPAAEALASSNAVDRPALGPGPANSRLPLDARVKRSEPHQWARGPATKKTRTSSTASRRKTVAGSGLSPLRWIRPQSCVPK